MFLLNKTVLVKTMLMLATRGSLAYRKYIRNYTLICGLDSLDDERSEFASGAASRWNAPRKRSSISSSIRNVSPMTVRLPSMTAHSDSRCIRARKISMASATARGTSRREAECTGHALFANNANETRNK